MIDVKYGEQDDLDILMLEHHLTEIQVQIGKQADILRRLYIAESRLKEKIETLRSIRI